MSARLAILVLVVCGCVVRARLPPPGPMPGRDAVAIATYYARDRGLEIDSTRQLWIDRRGRWHVDLAGAGGRDWAMVVVDGFSGRVIHARLPPRRGAPPPPLEAPGGSSEPPSNLPPQPNTTPPPPPTRPPPPPGSAVPPSTPQPAPARPEAPASGQDEPASPAPEPPFAPDAAAP